VLIKSFFVLKGIYNQGESVMSAKTRIPKMFFRLLAAVFSVSLLFSQSADTLRTTAFGGAGYDEGLSVRAAADGGYIFTGTTYSYGSGGSDLYLVKVSAAGETVWEKARGGVNNDMGNSLLATSDGGGVVTGIYYGENRQLWILRFDADGDTLWSRTFGGDKDEKGLDIISSDDGGFAVAGVTFSFGSGTGDGWLIKTDDSGDSLWAKSYGGAYDEFFYSVRQTADGGYILTGYNSSIDPGNYDLWLVKTDADGDSLWSKTYGGGDFEMGTSVNVTPDGGYIITGKTDSYGAGGSDLWLIKTDSNGDTLWTRTYGGASNEEGRSVRVASDGGYIITGSTGSYGNGSYDVWLLKTNTDGELLWSETFGGTGIDKGYSVEITGDNSFLIMGKTKSYGAGDYDAWLIEYERTATAVLDSDEMPPGGFVLYRNYPNPFNPVTRIGFNLPVSGRAELSVYNLLGEKVAAIIDKHLSAGRHEFDFNASGLPSGIYFYLLRSGGYREVKKMILVK
jgi:hypothetical protein